MSKSCDRFVDAYPEQWAKLREEAIAMAPDLKPIDIEIAAQGMPAAWMNDLKFDPDAEFIVAITRLLLERRAGAATT